MLEPSLLVPTCQFPFLLINCISCSFDEPLPILTLPLTSNFLSGAAVPIPTSPDESTVTLVLPEFSNLISVPLIIVSAPTVIPELVLALAVKLPSDLSNNPLLLFPTSRFPLTSSLFCGLSLPIPTLPDESILTLSRLLVLIITWPLSTLLLLTSLYILILEVLSLLNNCLLPILILFPILG